MILIFLDFLDAKDWRQIKVKKLSSNVRLMKIIFIIFFILLPTTACVSNSVKTTEIIIEKGFDETFILAKQGDPEAQFTIGYMYFYELGLPANKEETSNWIRISAANAIGSGESSLEPLSTISKTNKEQTSANSKWYKKNEIEAAKWYKKAAEQDHTKAQFYLGDIYHSGRGLHKNNGEAFKWTKIAAEKGFVDAQLNLGNFFENGVGVPKNNSRALEWYLKAAKNGHKDAPIIIADMYLLGIGTPKNEVEALKWYKKAQNHQPIRAKFMKELIKAYQELRPKAEKGNAKAQIDLGVSYMMDGIPGNREKGLVMLDNAAKQGFSDGYMLLGGMHIHGPGFNLPGVRIVGVERNIAEGITWIRKAASYGNPRAFEWMTAIYSLGIGNLPKDKAKIYAYASIAVKLRHSSARNDNTIFDDWTMIIDKDDLKELNSKMTSEETAAAHVLATKCIESHYKNCAWD